MTTYDLSNWTPAELQLPAKFKEFRSKQLEAVEALTSTSKRVFLGSMPTGFGKSLVVATAAKVLGARTVVVTSTKNLQEQYLRDFREIGMVDIRGKNNYPCGYKPGYNCKQGATSNCPLVKGGGCTYESARGSARAADLLVTNYAYWVRTLEYPDGGLHSADNPVELLVLDEGHKAVDELSKCLQQTLRETWILSAQLSNHPKHSDDLTAWVKWAFSNTTHVEFMRREIGKAYRLSKTPVLLTKLQQLEDLQESMESMQKMDSAHWICEQREGTQFGRMWDFHPIWPAFHAERYLFGGVKRVAIISATIRPMTAGMLGIKADNYQFSEYPRTFPPQFAPVYLYRPDPGEPQLRVKYQMTDKDLARWVARIDDILAQRMDRKGLVHTVSYERQKYLLAHSRFRSRFLANLSDPNSPSALEVVEEFRASSDPLVLVSPSVGTGWDFPGSQAEFQVIAKLPFPEIRSKLMKARIAINERYPMYQAMQELVQACGRVNRTPTDRAETFVVDDNLKWFWQRYKALAPSWFEWREISKLPTPPPSELVS